MEESVISNFEKNIQSMNNKIFIHAIKPEFIPVGMTFEFLSNIDNLMINSYSEIAINDLLDYIEYDTITVVIEKIFTKLESGGSLTIQSIDYRLLASSITFNDLEPKITKALLCGHRNNIHTMNEIFIYLDRFNITEKKYTNVFEYFIRATKE